MATPTQLDLIDAVQYLTNRDALSYIPRWRAKFPHILINYTIRWATNFDYYVPQDLRQTTAVVVTLDFSKEGCEAMSCYPYTETGVIDYFTSPIGGYTQTSNTAVQYNQPACFHLDSALAARDNNIQSVELRYAPTHNKCVMVDSMTKVWMNAPYLRTSKHVVRGVDDVPGFDVAYDSNPDFPERISAKFNDAYCRRFGRFLSDNACSQPWYEVFVSFILGESILTTFKLATQHVFDDLRDYDYTRPSAVLPEPPQPEGVTMLEEWLRIRDSTLDTDAEEELLANIFPMRNINEQLVYTANKGFNLEPVSQNSYNGLVEELLSRRRLMLYEYKGAPKNATTNNLESVIIEFLEDHSFLLGILVDMGFDSLTSSVTMLITQLNKVLIPSLKRMLLMQSRRVTAVLLGETYKAAMVHALNRTFIATISVVAKATVRTVKAALSTVNLALTFLTVADIVLMIWDPFGYSNMFPRNYLDDLSNAFLAAYYESIDAPTRDLITFQPLHYSNLVFVDDEEYFAESMLHLADYLAALDINSNGQVIDLMQGETIDDFDEQSLTGVSLAANDTWAYFKWFCERHNYLLSTQYIRVNHIVVGGTLSVCIACLVYYMNIYDTFTNTQQHVHVHLLLLSIVVLCVLLYMLPSLQYYFSLIKHGYNL
uniref:p74 n=1 Tax=Erinnyis ello granulovirus TaxID=307444 RepID=A0A288WH80_9BBAC|nr:p74 [Erinnyis ello granulovirus]ARX71524.1 p74 [Erinnyis ello granulovirus]